MQRGFQSLVGCDVAPEKSFGIFKELGPGPEAQKNTGELYQRRLETVAMAFSRHNH